MTRTNERTVCGKGYSLNDAAEKQNRPLRKDGLNEYILSKCLRLLTSEQNRPNALYL